MIEVKNEWTEECLRKYVLYKFLFSDKLNIAAIVMFVICFAAIVISCVAVFAMTEAVIFLIIAAAVTLLAAGIALFFVIRVNKSVKASAESAKEISEEGSTVLTEDRITLCKNKAPYGEIKWDDITAINFNDKGKAAYLSSKDGTAIILEYKNIVLGTEKELKEMLFIKNVKLSEKA